MYKKNKIYDKIFTGGMIHENSIYGYTRIQ